MIRAKTTIRLFLSRSITERLFTLAAAGFAAATVAAPADGPYVGGVFARKPVAAVSSPVPAPIPSNKAWTQPLERDAQGRTSQLVVRLNSRSAGLATALSRSTLASELDARPAFERSFVITVDTQRDPALLQALGGPVAARPVISHGRRHDEARLAAEGNDPAEHLQQFIVLRYASVAEALSAEKKLRATDWILSVQNDIALSPSAVPVDTLYTMPVSPTSAAQYQWGMHAMEIANAWERTSGHAYVGIADAPIWQKSGANVYDFGTTANPTIQNPDLRLNVRQQFASVTHDAAVTWSSYYWDFYAPHGGHVTGIIAGAASTSLPYANLANSVPRNLGVAGGCPNCSVIFSGVIASGVASEIANAITGLVDRGAQVINLSSNADAAGTACPSYDPAATAIAYAVSRDVLFVNSSGNQNSALGANYPSNCPGALAVGAAQTASAATPGSGWTRWTFGGNNGSNYTQGGGVAV